MGVENEERGHCLLRKAAFFMVGFTLLLSLRVGLNAASYCLVRFQLAEEMFSLYVNRVHNAMELFCFIGVILGNVYTTTYKKHFEILSIAFSWFFYLSILAIMIVFVLGGAKGHLTIFYWSLAISAFIYGVQQVFIFSLGGSDIVYFLAAVPLSGIFVSIYHVTFLRCFGDRSKYNTDLNLVAFQLVLSVMISIASAGLWSFVFLEEKCKKEQHKIIPQVDEQAEERNLKKLEEGTSLTQVTKDDENKEFPFQVLSPMFMCIAGLGIVFAFYPGIAPGMLMNFKHVYKVDIAIMVLAAVPSVVIVLVSELTSYGPNKKWEGWNSFWHGGLIFTFIEISCGLIFIYVIHHKKSSLANFILQQPLAAGIITVVFYVCQNFSIGIGFAGVEPNSNSKFPPINLFLTLLTMIFFEFLGEGYVMELKKYNEATWPTIGMDCLQSFIFWFKHSASNAFGSFMSIPTKNLRRDLLLAIAEPLN